MIEESYISFDTAFALKNAGLMKYVVVNISVLEA